MHIIFDENLVPNLRERYIILELDTILQPNMDKPLTLHALIEDMDITTISNLPILIEQHNRLIDNYKSSHWQQAINIANALRGSWKGALDEFYDLVIEISNQNQKDNLIWDGIRHITPSE